MLKKFLRITALSLCLVNLSWAEDIKDFQIGGISVGDSLLDFMSEQDINNKSTDKWFYKNDEYYYHYYPSLNLLKTYTILASVNMF